MERIIDTTVAAVETSVETVVANAAIAHAVADNAVSVSEALDVLAANDELAIEEQHAEEAAITASEEVETHESKLEKRLVHAATVSTDASLVAINAALRETVKNNGGEFHKVSELKHYNNIYKFITRGEDFSLEMLTSIADKIGYKIDVIITAKDESVDGINDANQLFIDAVANAVNAVIAEKFLATKGGAKAQESEEKRAEREAAKKLAKDTKDAEKAKKLADKQAEKDAKQAEKDAAKAKKDADAAAAKAAKDAEKAVKAAEKQAEKDAAKAAKDAEKAAAKAAEAAPVNLANVDTIALGADLLTTPVAELAPVELTESDLLTEAVAEEAVVADDSGVSATDGIKVNLADLAASLNS